MPRRRCLRFRPSLGRSLAAFLLLPAALPAGAAAAAATPTPRGAKPHHHAKPKIVPSEVALAPTLIATPGATVTMPPVGLSIEYPVMAHDLGSEACPPAALTAELERLGSPPIELGGVSQDSTAPSGALSGPATSWETANLFSLPSPFWEQLHCLLGAAKDPLTVGLNVRTGTPVWAAAIAAEARVAATNGLSFSLGNEPDLYDLPNYAALAKPMPGAEAAAASLYLKLAGALREAIGSAALVGPELARPEDWQNQLAHVLSQLGAQTVGVHSYPLSACRSSRAVTLAGLLSAQAANAPARLRWVVEAAQALGLPAILSEANSASCGGLAGVSDAPAAGVWAARYVLSALKTGFREVRFHFSGDPYDPFIVHGTEVVPRPLESALVALNQWLPMGATLRSIPRVRDLVATAIGEPGGSFLVILDNERSDVRPVLLRGTPAVTVTLLNAQTPGLTTYTAADKHGSIRLSLAPNTVVAIDPS